MEEMFKKQEIRNSIHLKFEIPLIHWSSKSTLKQVLVEICQHWWCELILIMTLRH